MGEYSSLYEKIRKKNLGEPAPASTSSGKTSAGSYGSIYDRIKNDHVTQPAAPTFAVDRKRIKDVPDNYDVNIGRSGWLKYVEEQERIKAEAKAAEEAKPWWEKMLGYLGEAQDTTMSMGSVPDIIDSYRTDTSYMEPNDDWLDEERYVFGFLYDTDRAAASLYAERVNDAINAEKKAAQVQNVQGSATDSFGKGVAHTVGAILTAPLGLADYLDDLAQTIGRGEIKDSGTITPFEYSQAVTGGVSQHLNEERGTLNEDIPIIGGKGLGDVYSLGTSIAQSAMAGYTGGSGQALVQFFGSAAASSVDDALSRGATEEQALTVGTVSGIAEGLMEMIGVDNLLNIGSSATMRELVINLIKQGGAEALEEGGTTLLNNIADQLVMQDKSNFNLMVQQYMADDLSEDVAKKLAWLDMAEDLAYDMVGGFVSGAVHAGPQTAVQTLRSNAQAKQIYGGSQSELVSEALETDPENAFAQKMQGRLDRGKQLSGGQLNRLTRDTETAMRAQDVSAIQSAAAQRLTELGESANVPAISAALAKQAAGQELSRAEQQTISKSQYGQRVANELNPENISSGEYSGEWAQQIGTKRINAEEYGRMLQAAQEVQEDANIAEPQAAAEVQNEPEAAEAPAVEAPAATAEVQQESPATTEEAAAQADETQEESTVRLEDVSKKYGAQAMAMVRTYNVGGGKQNVEKYDAAYERAYDMGRSGVSLSYAMNSTATSYLTEKQRELAYEAGTAAADTAAKEHQARNVAAANGKKGRKVGHVKGEGVTIGDLKKTFNDTQNTAYKLLSTYAEATGIDIVLYRSEADAQGNFQGAQGRYSRSEPGTIYIDINAGLANIKSVDDLAKYAMLRTFAHEFVHFIENWNPVQYNEFRRVVFDTLAQRGEDVEFLIEQKQQGGLDYEKASREVVAEAMTDILPDANFVETLANKHKTIFDKLLAKLKEFVAQLKAYYNSIGKNRSREANALKEQVGDAVRYVENIVQLFDNVAVQAVENYQKTVATEEVQSGENSSREFGENGDPVYALTRKDANVEATDLRSLAKLQKETAEKLGLNDSEASALSHYVKGALCYEMNRRMEAGTMGEGDQRFAKRVQDALLKFPKFNGRTYRNLKFDTEADYNGFLERFALGETVPLQAFTSASKRPNGYPMFGPYVVHMVIDGKQGADIADAFGIPRQQEVIFLPKTQIRITEIKTANDGHPLIYAQEVAANGTMEEENGGDHGNGRSPQGNGGNHAPGGDGTTASGTSGNGSGGVRGEAQGGRKRDGLLPQRGESGLVGNIPGAPEVTPEGVGEWSDVYERLKNPLSRMAKFATGGYEFEIRLTPGAGYTGSIRQHSDAYVTNARGLSYTSSVYKARNDAIQDIVDVARNNKLLESGTKPTETAAKTASERLAELVLRNYINEENINQGRKMLTSKLLYALADEAFGGTQAEGAYNRKDAYDAMELAVNKFLLQYAAKAHKTFNGTAKSAVSAVEFMEDMLELLPTQNVRTQEMEDFQQFSTPPNIAYLAAWAANITSRDMVLEPSAGIGGLAVFAKAWGAEVAVNELSKRRLEVLRAMGFDHLFNENAEQIDNILPQSIAPSVVIMNPPFSSTAGRTANNKTSNAEVHLNQALERLQDGGRLVAVLGKSMNDQDYYRYWDKLRKSYSIRANLSIDGSNYKKYGTTWGVQIVVIDKTGPQTGKTVTGRFTDLTEVPKVLEGIRNDRSNVEANRAGSSNDSIRESVADGGDGQSRAGHQGGSKRSDGSAAVSQRKANRKSPEGAERTGDRADGKGPAETGSAQTERQDGGTDRTAGRTDPGDGYGAVEPGAVDRHQPELSPAQLSESEEVSDDGVYATFVLPDLPVKGGRKHPAVLVESAAMAAVSMPKATYKPKLPADVVKNKLSDAQMVTVTYAGQAHEQKLPDGRRKGFFIGDGTGVGKGRQIAGIILDNFMQGRTKAVWISKNDDLYGDAIRDWTATTGRSKDEVVSQGKFKPKDSITLKSGILFTSYGKLKMEKGGNRLEQIVEWLGEDFDGVIAFDEAHHMGNLFGKKGKFGKSKGSLTAKAGVELQRRLPNARIVYVSATAATEVDNLAYAERIGLWGQGTAFSTAQDFISKIGASGLAAMELVIRDMKAMGTYVARSISYNGVNYDTVEHGLDPMQTEIYNTMSRAWQKTMQNVQSALETTGGQYNSTERQKALGNFYSAMQRFYNQVLTSMSMPSVIADIRRELAAGHSAVLQIVNTNEAQQNKQLAEAKAAGESLDNLDLTPREALIGYLTTSFPTQMFEEYTDDDGNLRSRPVMDSAGNPVQNKAAIRQRDALIAEVNQMSIPDGPLEMLFDAFGPEAVAENTGRSRRVVPRKQADGTISRVEERRTLNHRTADVQAFQDGKKRILVFSDAGGTGKSYHADRSEKNQQLRVHYVLQPGWVASNAVQGFGRTHRSNEALPPVYKLVTTNIKGQKRFTSTIARRLDQLGALTKGQRDTGSGMFGAKDNLETDLAKDSLREFYRRLGKNQIEGIDGMKVLDRLGLKQKFTDEYGGFKLNDNLARDIGTFLNRILALEVDEQNVVFDAFISIYEMELEAAIQAGTLDTGMENVKADRIEVVDDKVIREDKNTGAATHYIQAKTYTKPKVVTTVAEMEQRRSGFVGIYRTESGAVKAVYRIADKTTEWGAIQKQYRLVGPNQGAKNSVWGEATLQAKAEPIDKADWQKEWDAEVKKVPEYNEDTLHMLTGALLPIWNSLPQEGNTKVKRLIAHDGTAYLGRVIDKDDIDGVLKGFSIGRTVEVFTAQQVMDKALNNGIHFYLTNDKTQIFRSRVSGQWRLEITQPYNSWYLTRRYPGIMQERINYRDRYFIPVGEKGLPILEKLLADNPVRNTTDDTEQYQSRDYLRDADPAPVFYSQMAKVIDEIRPAKMSANGVVNYLTGKGVKAEEIKWSGIEAFLEGKKSVTKAELQEFATGSMLEIVEETSGSAVFVTEDGTRYESEAAFKDAAYAIADRLNIARERVKFIIDTEYDMDAYAYVGNLNNMILSAAVEEAEGTSPRFTHYKMDGGSNYREIVFRLPNSSYSNRAMRTHWGDEAEGVLAHARIQDMEDYNGKRVLLVEEIQSDWHNEGAKTGYAESREAERIDALRANADELFLRVEDYSVEMTGLAGEWETIEKTAKGAQLLQEYREAEAAYKKASDDFFKKVPDAPFRNTYHEYVLKRLIRMAAEQGYDKLAWTPAQVQSERWSDEYAEGYRIEYDQDIPKFLNKYGKKWGVKVGKSTVYGNYDVWAIDITDAMRESVLYEGQPQYQQRTDTLTDRDVLAIAAHEVEVADLSDAERDALKIFQDRLARLQSLQEERAEQGRLYKEQQFGANVDRAAASETLNRMHVLDAQIRKASEEVLDVEKKTVLRRVLQKARKVVEQKEREHGQEVLKRWRDRRNNAAAIKKYRDRIRGDVDDLKNWVLHPDNKSLVNHIPDALKETVLPFLSSINFVSKQQLRGGGATVADKAFMQQLRKLEAVMAKTVDLDEMYSNYTDLPPDFMQKLRDFIRAAQSIADNSNGEFIINQMTAEELKKLSEVVRTLKTYIKKFNSFHVNAMFRHVYEAGDDSIHFLSLLKPAENTGAVSEFLLWQQMRPAYAFERFGEGGKAIYDGLRRGQAKLAFNTKEIQAFAAKVYTAAEVSAWEKSVKTIDLGGGESVKMRVSQIMSLYELSKRKQALGHILGGGIRVATFKNGRRKISDNGHTLTEAELNTIIQTLTPRQMEVADKLQQYMEKQGGEWGNHVSVARFGERQFGEEHYFPINSDGRHLQVNADEKPGAAALYALLNMGFTKQLQEEASNRIVVYSIFDVFSNHMASMAQYNAFALPVVDALKWFNYKQVVLGDDGSKTVLGSVREQMNRAYGVPEENRPGSGKRGYAENFIINIIKAFNGTEAQGAPLDSWGLQTLHHYNRAQVAYNFRVVVQQPLAITRAAALVDYTSIIKGMKLSPAAIQKNIQEMQKYSGIAAWKSLGFYDVNISRGLTSLIKHDDTVMDKITDVGMWGAEKADLMTWAAIWSASKEEVIRKQKLTPKSEGFYEAVTKLFEDVIYKTQVVDSVLTKNEFMRDKGLFARLTGSFMSEPTTTASMLLDAFDKYQMDMQRGMSRQQAWKKNGRMIGRLAYVYGLGAVLLAAVQAVADAFRDDDDYQTFLEKWLEAFGGNVVDELMPLNKLPIVSDLYEAVKEAVATWAGWDTYGNAPQSVYMQWYDSLMKGMMILHDKVYGEDTNYTWYGGAYKLLQAISGMTGLPMAAATREIVTAWNNTVGAMAPSLKVKTYEPSEKSQIKYAYQDGYLSAEEATEQLLAQGLVDSENEAYWTIQGWDDPDGSYSRYDAIFDVVRNGGDFNAAVRELTSHGYTEKDVRSQVKGKIGEWYKGGEITKQQATQMLTRYSGMEGDEITAVVNKWSSKVVTGIDYEDIGEEYKAGNITAQRAKQMYRLYGGMTEERASEKVAVLDFAKEYPDYDDISYAAVESYQTYCEPAGVPVGTFYDAWKYNSNTDADVDANGNSISGSKKVKVLAYIDGLSLTYPQKDSLYYAFGWAESRIYEAPWH